MNNDDVDDIWIPELWAYTFGLVPYLSVKWISPYIMIRVSKRQYLSTIRNLMAADIT